MIYLCTPQDKGSISFTDGLFVFIGVFDYFFKFYPVWGANTYISVHGYVHRCVCSAERRPSGTFSTYFSMVLI